MNRMKRWTVAPPHAAAAELAARLKTSPVIAQVLLNRGLSADDDCRRFLQPTLKSLHDPAMIPGLAPAAERIARAIRAREKIVIYGDYDVDGITATTILWHAIKLLGGEVDYYIPHRIEEGYGLNSAAITEIIAGGAKLIVTVDCGVTAIEPANAAREADVDLIITDHHEWHVAAPTSGMGVSPMSSQIMGETPMPGNYQPILPRCCAIVHPRLPAEPMYPNPHLCGAGVAFKLAWGFGQAVNGAAKVSDEFREFLIEATALAALGTIADVVPLVGENRILAAFGLSGLKASKLLGIQALIESAGLTGQTLDSYHVGFLLAPRLNACGRMGHATLAVEMLTRADADRANEIAKYLESQNRERQAIEKTICADAIEQVEKMNLAKNDCRAIVLASDKWHQGVIGIVASRLVERFCRPTILISLNGEIGQGSGRSIPGFHLARALEVCTEHLEGHGGHEMAAGLKIRPENFEAFRECFCDYANKIIRPEQLIPELKLDAIAELSFITQPLVNDLHRLAPFGHGNRRPVFCARGLQLAAAPRRVGKTGDHLQLFVRQGSTSMKAIAFGHGALFDRLQAGVTVDVAFEPMLNEYNGFTTVELQVKDVQFANAGG